MNKKVVLVTGASSGFGELVVEKLLNKGYIVYAAARRVERMIPLEKKGAKLLSMDVTSDEQVKAGIDFIIKNEGSLYGLVNNAGYGGYGMIENVNIDEAERQFQVNVFGLARVIQNVLPHMRAKNEGRIVNLSSLAGYLYFPMGGWYTASKHAVEALSDSLRNEVKDFGIQVSIIEPSAVQTEFLDRAMENVDAVKHAPCYQGKVKGFKKAFRESYAKAPGPEDTANAILAGIDSKRPKTRYPVSGARGPIMLTKILSDRLLDRIITKTMGQ